ncbi:MAG: hypothetical protein PVJ64_10735 [Gemmatimonadales bacterium]|jgi:hypothetical protein
MRSLRPFGALALLALTSALSGCTLIGYGLGSAIDASDKQTFAPEAFAPQNAGYGLPESGAKLKVNLKDGEVVEGKYLGVERLPAEEYARVYAEARERYELQSALPEPGDSVTLALVTGRMLHGEFLGYEGRRWVVFKRETPWRVAAADVREMTGGSDCRVSGETLDRLISSGAVPTMSALALEVVSGRWSTRRTERRLIPLDSVTSATYKPTSGRMAGGLLGLAVDIALGMAAVAAVPDLGVFTFGGG